MNNYQAQQFWNDINGVIGFVTSIAVFGFLFGMTKYITKPLGNPNTKALPPAKEAKGTCYEDAWRFLIKEEEGELIHGSVQLTEEGPRVKHAWVELPTGYIWEPQTGQYFTRKDFRVLDPIEEHRYSVEEAAIMLARVGKHGPWTDEERAKWVRERHSTKTVYITAEAQSAMLDLIKRAKGKKVEYQLELLLEGDKIYPGATKWGAPERLRAFETGIGTFHTHPAERRLVEVRPKVRYELIPRPAKLSQIDILHILVNPRHKLIGVGGTEIYLVRTVPYGIEETSDVQFATLVEGVSPEARKGFLEIMPMVVAFDVPVENIEHYYHIYEFTLGRRPIPIEILE